MWPRPGYWAAYDSSSSVTKCSEPNPASRCTGWSVALGATLCGVGYRQGSYLCGACASGFYLKVCPTLVGPCLPRSAHAAFVIKRVLLGRWDLQCVPCYDVKVGSVPWAALHHLRRRGIRRPCLAQPGARRASPRRDPCGRRHSHGRPRCLDITLDPGLHCSLVCPALPLSSLEDFLLPLGWRRSYLMPRPCPRPHCPRCSRRCTAPLPYSSFRASCYRPHALVRMHSSPRYHR